MKKDGWERHIVDHHQNLISESKGATKIIEEVTSSIIQLFNNSMVRKIWSYKENQYGTAISENIKLWENL